MTDRIDAKDAHGDTFFLLRGEALQSLEPTTTKTNTIVGIHVGETVLTTLTEDLALGVASFLVDTCSPAAARDLLTELAPRVCADDMPESIKAFLVGASPEWMQRTVAQGLERGALVRQLVELGRALGRAEAKGEVSDGR